MPRIRSCGDCSRHRRTLVRSMHRSPGNGREPHGSHSSPAFWLTRSSRVAGSLGNAQPPCPVAFRLHRRLNGHAPPAASPQACQERCQTMFRSQASREMRTVRYEIASRYQQAPAWQPQWMRLALRDAPVAPYLRGSAPRPGGPSAPQPIEFRLGANRENHRVRLVWKKFPPGAVRPQRHRLRRFPPRLGPCGRRR